MSTAKPKPSEAARERAQYALAVASSLKALAIFDRLERPSDAVDCWYGLANVHRQRSEFDEARVHYQTGLDLARETGNVYQQSECINGLGEVARYQGRLDEAQALYLEASTQMERVGSRDSVFPRLYLALTLILRGVYDDALAELTALLAQIGEEKAPGVFA